MYLVYSIHANSNGASYSGGTRYVSTGVNPDAWSSWYSESCDLLFKVIIKIIP